MPSGEHQARPGQPVPINCPARGALTPPTPHPNTHTHAPMLPFLEIAEL
jgi:hypothetical protein